MKNISIASILLFLCFTNLFSAQGFDLYKVFNGKKDTLQNNRLINLHYQPVDDAYQIVGIPGISIQRKFI